MLQGFQFDKMQAYPTTDASLFSYLAGDRSFIIPNRGNELNVTTSELNITVDTGEALILGRQIKITEPMVLTIGANQSGYLVIEIDLSKANTSTGTPGQPDYEPINNQLSLKFVNNLTQDNINDGGLIYQFNLGTVSSTSNSITFNKASNIMGGVYRKLLFQGAINSGTLTLNDSANKYKELLICYSSENTASTYDNWSRVLIFPESKPPTVSNSVVISSFENNQSGSVHVTVIGRIIIDGNTIQIFYPIMQIKHNKGGNHAQSYPNGYYIRQVWGVR